MSLQPVRAPSAVGHQGNPQLVSPLHLFYDQSLQMLLLLWGDTEVEFVVHLQYHLGAHPLGLQSLLYAYHGPLDDIGRAALYGSIDGIALGIPPHHSIVAARH